MILPKIQHRCRVVIMFLDEQAAAPVAEDWSFLGLPDLEPEGRDWVVLCVLDESPFLMLFDRKSHASGLVVDPTDEELARAAVAKAGSMPWLFPERVIIPHPAAED